MQAYCVKCKKKGQEMKDPEIVQTKKGGFMAKGSCPDCSTKMCAMTSKENAQKAIEDSSAKKGY